MFITCDVLVEELSSAGTATRSWKAKRVALEIEPTESDGSGDGSGQQQQQRSGTFRLPFKDQHIPIDLSRVKCKVYSSQVARGIATIRFFAPISVQLFISECKATANELIQFCAYFGGPLPVASTSNAAAPATNTATAAGAVAAGSALMSPPASERGRIGKRAAAEALSPDDFQFLSPHARVAVQSHHPGVISRARSAAAASATATASAPAVSVKRKIALPTSTAPSSARKVVKTSASDSAGPKSRSGVFSLSKRLSGGGNGDALSASKFSVAGIMNRDESTAVESKHLSPPSSAASSSSAAAPASSTAAYSRRTEPLHHRRRAAFTEEMKNATLSSEQKHVLQLVYEGHNVFFSGSAGTGKSFLLHSLLRCLPVMDGSVSATSSTGITATHIGGVTLYSWSGMGAAEQSKEQLLLRVQSNKDAVDRWQRVGTLIIDEVSMLSADLFDKLEFVASNIRSSQLIKQRQRAARKAGMELSATAAAASIPPFGGIQLIVTGDFFQLPPVSKAGARTLFCFESDAWARAMHHSVELTQVFRQSNPEFIKVLNEIRRGVCTDDAFKLLTSRTPAAIEQSRLAAAGGAAGVAAGAADAAARDGIVPTLLETRKNAVDSMNQQQLDLLPGKAKQFRAHETGTRYLMEQLRNSCPARSPLHLKVGAQVILLKNVNVSQGLCNGSRGVLVRFTDDSVGGFPVVRFANGKEHIIKHEKWTITMADRSSATLEQIPLDLAWSISIHKSQGMSLDRAKISLTSVFEFGQTYVALSRVRSLDGLELIGFDRTKSVKCHPRVKEFYAQLTADAPPIPLLPSLVTGKPSDAWIQLQNSYLKAPSAAVASAASEAKADVKSQSNTASSASATVSEAASASSSSSSSSSSTAAAAVSASADAGSTAFSVLRRSNGESARMTAATPAPAAVPASKPRAGSATRAAAAAAPPLSAAMAAAAKSRAAALAANAKPVNRPPLAALPPSIAHSNQSSSSLRRTLAPDFGTVTVKPVAKPAVVPLTTPAPAVAAAPLPLELSVMKPRTAARAPEVTPRTSAPLAVATAPFAVPPERPLPPVAVPVSTPVVTRAAPPKPAFALSIMRRA